MVMWASISIPRSVICVAEGEEGHTEGYYCNTSGIFSASSDVKREANTDDGRYDGTTTQDYDFDLDGVRGASFSILSADKSCKKLVSIL